MFQMSSESPRKGQENSPGGYYFTPTKGGAPGSASGKSDGSSSSKKNSSKVKGRYRGGRSKKVDSVSSTASVASSDAGSYSSSSNMGSPYPDDAAKQHLQFSDKKKRNNRRRRNKQPKLRNKVESPHTPYNNNNSHDHHQSEKPYLNSATREYAFGWNSAVCPASMGRATSKKKHDAPMMKRDLYFSLCCERVAIGGKNGATAEDAKPETADADTSAKSDAVARVTMINWENETVLDIFVVVPVPVTDFYDTGITPEDVASESTKAKSFAEVRKTVDSTLKGKILIGHDVEHHLMSLGLAHPSTDTRDCDKFFPEYALQEEGGGAAEDGGKGSCLESLCKKRLQRSLPPSGHSERPMQNCLATLDLYKKYRKEWEQFLIAEARKKQDQDNQRATNAVRQQQQRPFPQQHGYTSPQTHPLPPRARLGSSDTVNSAMSARSMNSMADNIVALHCETVQTTNNTLAIARVTAMNGFHEVMWDVFVEVYMPIVTSGDSSIVPEDLIAANGAVPLAHVRSTVEQMLHGKLVVGYKIDAALQALGLVLPPVQLRDAAYFRPFMYAEMDGVSGTPVVVERSLDELSLEILQKPLALPVNRSRPLAACSTVLALYQMHQDRWEQEAFMMQQQGPGPHSMPYAGGNRLIQPANKSSSSWFSWGKKSQQEMQPQPPYYHQQQFQPSVAATGAIAPTTALSEQAFQALHGDAIPPSPSHGFRDGSSLYDGSSQVEPSTLFDGSSRYDRSAHATFDDSSRGVVETFTAPSVVSSQHDEASFGVNDDTTGDTELTTTYQKSSSWFRFGSKKSRYSSPSSSVSMMAVQEKVEEPTAPLLEAAVLDSSVAPDNVYSLNAVDDDNGVPQSSDPKSRSWFGFRRRSLSPSRMAATQAGQGGPRSPSPDSPQSGPTAATSGSDDMYDPRVVTSNTAMDAIEVSLSATGGEQVAMPLRDVPETTILSQSERSGASNSWFNFRKSKSTKASSDAPSDEPREDPLRMERASDRASDQGDSLAATGKTDGADEDWLQEVMSQSTGTGDDLNSVGFASILDAETGNGESKAPEKPRKSRGSSWFGFKRSKSSKASRLDTVSDTAEDGASNNGGHKLPGLVSIDNNQKDSIINNNDAWANVAAGASDSSTSHLGVAWCLGANDNVPGRQRSRLPTESTVPTVSTEEEGTDNSGKDFAEEFEKGVAQSFAYLEI